ncbi:hypothetical protein T01_5905 [Trichinella spiralis]|uniref:Uncharacterized protein n=1 Tax=Trichinella spiralis TaxID=6334 RepID=A0A0V1B7T9_TRISP|nr:hypothetical protein T01_5905 [Trichinella spiralis]
MLASLEESGRKTVPLNPYTHKRIRTQTQHRMGYFSNLLECFADVHAVAGAVYPSGLKNHMNRILFAFVSETNLSKLARDVDDYNCRRCLNIVNSTLFINQYA